MRKTAITAGLLALITHAVAQNQGQERPRQGGVSYPPQARGRPGRGLQKDRRNGAEPLRLRAAEPQERRSDSRPSSSFSAVAGTPAPRPSSNNSAAIWRRAAWWR